MGIKPGVLPPKPSWQPLLQLKGVTQGKDKQAWGRRTEHFHWPLYLGTMLTIPLSPHTAIPTAPVDSTTHVSPNQTHLRSLEGKRPALGRAPGLSPCKSWWLRPEEPEVRD